MRMLLESGEGINAAQRGCDEHRPGWTRLMHVVVHGPHRMAKVLLESNAVAHAKNSFEKDALALAARGPPNNEMMLSPVPLALLLDVRQGRGGRAAPPPLWPVGEREHDLRADACRAMRDLCANHAVPLAARSDQSLHHRERR